MLPKGLTCLTRRGHLLTYGQSAGPSPAIDWPPRGMAGSFYLSNHQGVDYSRPGEQTNRRAHEIFGWVTSGALKVRIHKEYALADAVQAHRDLGSRATIGGSCLLHFREGRTGRLTPPASPAACAAPDEAPLACRPACRSA